MKSQGEQTTLLGRTVVGMTALTAVIAVLMVATPSEARTGTNLHALLPDGGSAKIEIVKGGFPSARSAVARN